MNGEGRVESGPGVVRSEGWLLATGGLRLAAAIVLAVVALVPGLGGPTATRVLLGAAAVAVAVVALRTFLGGVFVEADGVLVRNPFRSRHVRWDEIDGVAQWRRSPLVALSLRGGRQVPVCAVGWPSAAGRERVAALLLAARAGHES